ncbi:YaaW family protein [Treponema sp.]|uniref:YaaW family protein n=1 Tax=Treponema sp. TaxID=166 RepID=UPI002A830FCD|nr:ubiquinol-cytochrome C chaperone family protein [Treponema sp.]MCI6442142.1 DUF3944 domain-containing protein [Spirochaetia bacterium]MDY4133367.1 ubiquinol-cytochrome C chaperone family protein [Treponema sp.]
MASYDNDLNPVLERASDADLLPLVEYMLKKLSNGIDTDERYKSDPKKPTSYADLIADEIRLFGGNTFANLARGGVGVPYKEVVCDVADKMKVSYNKASTVERIELLIVQKIFEDSIEKMTEEDRQKLIKDLGIRGIPVGSSATMIMQAIIKMGGFKSYQIAVIVANSIAKFILGRGLSFAANASLTKIMSIFAGPLGWVISSLWTLIDIAGPSYKTTIPCVIHVAMLRQKQNC